MSAFRRLIAVFGGGILGLALLGFGAREFLQSKALQARGKSVLGKVIDSQERHGRRGRRSYYLTVSYQTEVGKNINSQHNVSQSVFETAASKGNVNVTYLPEKPDVCRFGPSVKTDFVNMGIGAFLLGCATVTGLRRK